jgi:hypothetical protein
MVAFPGKTVPEAPRFSRLRQRCRTQQKGCERCNDDFPHRYPPFSAFEPTTSGIVDQIQLTKQILDNFTFALI